MDMVSIPPKKADTIIVFQFKFFWYYMPAVTARKLNSAYQWGYLKPALVQFQYCNVALKVSTISALLQLRC
jgi:hypothetical protein